MGLYKDILTSANTNNTNMNTNNNTNTYPVKHRQNPSANHQNCSKSIKQNSEQIVKTR